ncbi:MAG: hypothetical protein WC629_00955 [Candidatus Paceibacterota bacterium]|jgi:hypothetical protein
MNYLSNLSGNKNKGFATLVPVVLLSAFALSLAYLLQYRVLNFQYFVLRYEKFLDEKFKRQSCENLGKLYLSFDPYNDRHCNLRNN